MFKCIDVDLVQRIKVTGLFFLQFYKVVTGTLLTLFIPQNCGGQICSLTENFENEENYHKGAFYWNILTMMLFLMSYAIELKRENWAIKYLDIDNNLPDNGLKSIIVKEKKLDKRSDYFMEEVLADGVVRELWVSRKKPKRIIHTTLKTNWFPISATINE